MKKISAWLEKDNYYNTFLKSIILALLPLTCCFIYLTVQGYHLNDVYLPSSEWSDELFYYKQVESIINYGYPLGYFGYNESHALMLSFGAWSPVLFFPWIIWGLLFGWHIMSPIFCNITLMCLSCLLFAWLVKPKWKQMGILCFLFCLYTPFVRYMLSGMPEVICFSMLIVFYALAMNYLQKKKKLILVVLFLLSILMTWMRPYLILFMLLPIWFWISRSRNNISKFIKLSISFLMLLIVLIVYLCIMHFFLAEYFTQSIFTDWIDVFFEKGFFNGFHYMISKIYYTGKTLFSYLKQSFHDGLASGAFFAGYFVCLSVLAVQLFHDWAILREKNNQMCEKDKDFIYSNLMIEFHLFFSFVAMLFAILLMYKLTEGSKHLLSFIAVAIFVIAMMETRFYKKTIVVGITFLYFYSYMALTPYDYQVPFKQNERISSVENWGEIFASELILCNEDVPNYENVIAWVYYDIVDGTSKTTQWQPLYSLPKGFGISCCLPEYILNNFDSLRSGYIYVQRGGLIEEKCLASGYLQIASDENVILFKTP